jgi:TPR repeat protein
MPQPQSVDPPHFAIYFPDDLPKAKSFYVRGDKIAAVNVLNAGREAGSASAACVLAELYLTGSTHLGRDRQRALELAYPHAVSGVPIAQFLVAWILVEERRRTDAIGFMRRAASQGFPAALLDMGRFYLNGVGVPRDVTAALTWYRRAAEAGHILGRRLILEQYALGRFGRVRQRLARALLPLSSLYVWLRYRVISPWSAEGFAYDYNAVRRAAARSASPPAKVSQPADP